MSHTKIEMSFNKVKSEKLNQTDTIAATIRGFNNRNPINLFPVGPVLLSRQATVTGTSETEKDGLTVSVCTCMTRRF